MCQLGRTDDPQNDLNLDYIVNDLIKTEIDDILSQTYVSPEEYIFSADNKPYGQSEKGANEVSRASSIHSIRMKAIAILYRADRP